MIYRPAEERGQADFGWLKANYTYSFSNYYDPKHMGFHSLRVLNEDRIAGRTGFPPHPHANMEIITFIMEGELTHKDSVGHRYTLKPGDIQVMTAGSGIVHSEVNSGHDETHLYQIWIEPKRRDQEPGYNQKNFSELFAGEGNVLIASGSGDKGSLVIGQDAEIWSQRANAGNEIVIEPSFARPIWIQVVRGSFPIGEFNLKESDGLGLEPSDLIDGKLSFVANSDTQIICFHL